MRGTSPPAKRLARAATIAATLLLSACAGPPILHNLESAPPAPIELGTTPFFAQEEYQCGPAALATILVASGVATRPEVLSGQVYLPARKGSLQPELLAATRRAGRIPYVIEPSLSTLVAELEAGRPVLVLQNLGVRLLPDWHYAVVVGIDPGRDRIVLRSGEERRQVLRTRTFLRTWNASKNWGMVALRPGELPAHGDRARYLEAVAATEITLPPAARIAAYRAALKRWPGSVVARFGWAHALYEAGDLQGAKKRYTEILKRHPRHAAALNNLAEVYSALGCHAQARRLAGRALEIARQDAPHLVDKIRETRDALPKVQDNGPGCRDGDAPVVSGERSGPKKPVVQR